MFRSVAKLDRGGLRAAYEACVATPCIARKLQGVPFARFCGALAGYRVLSFYVDGEPAGAAFFKDGDAHIAIAQEFRGRWATRSTLLAIFREWGDRRRALVDKENAPALDFVRRLGLIPRDAVGQMVRFA